jgi:hypothetical protein
MMEALRDIQVLGPLCGNAKISKILNRLRLYLKLLVPYVIGGSRVFRRGERKRRQQWGQV